MAEVIKGLGIEIDLSGDADEELRAWTKSLAEARGLTGDFEADFSAMEREMFESAKSIGLSGDQLKELVRQTRQAGAASEFAKKYGFAMSDVAGRVRGAKKEVIDFNAAVQGALAGGALSKLFDAGAGAVKLAAEYEQTKVSMDVLLGSADKATQTMKELDKFSSVTPFEPAQVLKAGKSLLAVKIPAEELIGVMKKVGDVAAGSGKDFNELATIMAKNKSSGFIQGDDLNQLIEAGIPIMDELSKQFGVSAIQVKDMASKNKIEFKDVMKAFESMTSKGGIYADMMEKLSQTGLGKWSTLKGNVDTIKRSVGEMIMNALAPLMDILIKGSTYLMENKEAMFIFKLAVLAIVPVIGVLLVGAVVSATSAFWGMAAGVLAATWPFMLVIAAVMAIVIVLEDLWQFFNGGESLIGPWIAGIWDDIKEVAGWIWDGFTELVAGVWQAILDFGAGVVDAITSPFIQAYESIKETLGPVWDFLFGDENGKEIKVSGNVSNQKVAGARAMGGPVTAGQTYLVGENGPELFTPDRNGAIVPGGAGGSAAGGSGQVVISTTLNFNGSVSREDGSYIKKVVEEAISKVVGEKLIQVRLGVGLEA